MDIDSPNGSVALAEPEATAEVVSEPQTLEEKVEYIYQFCKRIEAIAENMPPMPFGMFGS